MSGVLPSFFILGSVALAAVLLAGTRRMSADGLVCLRAARMLGVAVSVQTLHFVEEAAAGFHERFPALIGLPEIPFSLFLGFNLLRIGIWIVSIPGIKSGRPAAFFAAWFLALAGMLNGIGHPLMALALGGYIPGLVTSPLIGADSLWLWCCLRRATDPAAKVNDGH